MCHIHVVSRNDRHREGGTEREGEREGEEGREGGREGGRERENRWGKGKVRGGGGGRDR
jgi:hypothetical protein